MKECIKCHRLLDLSEYYRRFSMADGHRGSCIECDNEAGRKRYQYRLDNDPALVIKSRKRCREYQAHKRATDPTWKARKNKQIDEWVRRTKYKVDEYKAKAHNRVNNAIKAGRLLKPEICSRCNEIGNIHGHHADYSKPLEVEWLCTKCHGLHHRKAII